MNIQTFVIVLGGMLALCALNGGSVRAQQSGEYNVADLPEILTDRLRLEFAGNSTFSTGILQWKVIDSGKSPKFAPVVDAGSDRIVVLPSSVQLQAHIRGESTSATWTTIAGPGEVSFENARQVQTKATFSETGDYVIRLTAANSDANTSADVHVHVETAPTSHLDPVFTTSYSLDSPLWSDRCKQLIILQNILPPDAALAAQWEPDFLRGVTTIQGQFADGSKLTAIPYYTRNNRGGRSMVWIVEK
jgi:hypothetical protein